ncbi:hypothetical protein ACFSQ7_49335 [Paenibacillus rhizoplanae]
MVQVDGQETKVAARLTHKVFFERDDIEFTFQWLLSFAHCGGVAQGGIIQAGAADRPELYYQLEE